MQNLDVRMTLFKILVQIYIPRNTFNKHINSGFCLSLCNEAYKKEKVILKAVSRSPASAPCLPPT